MLEGDGGDHDDVVFLEFVLAIGAEIGVEAGMVGERGDF